MSKILEVLFEIIDKKKNSCFLKKNFFWLILTYILFYKSYSSNLIK